MVNGDNGWNPCGYEVLICVILGALNENNF